MGWVMRMVHLPLYMSCVLSAPRLPMVWVTIMSNQREDDYDSWEDGYVTLQNKSWWEQAYNFSGYPLFTLSPLVTCWATHAPPVFCSQPYSSLQAPRDESHPIEGFLKQNPSTSKAKQILMVLTTASSDRFGTVDSSCQANISECSLWLVFHAHTCKGSYPQCPAQLTSL